VNLRKGEGLRLRTVGFLAAACLATAGARWAQAGAAAERPAVELQRVDRQGATTCTMLVGGVKAWSCETPLLRLYDCDRQGRLVGVGTTTIAAGMVQMPAEAFFLVNTTGTIVRMSATTAWRGWPHGNVYPVVRGVHALNACAVLRRWLGPGFEEEWWTYEWATGGEVRRIVPVEALRAAEVIPRTEFWKIAAVEAAREQGLFAVVLAQHPPGQGADARANASLVATLFAAIDPTGAVVWSSRCPEGCSYGPVSVRDSDAGCVFEVDRISPTSTVRRSVELSRSADGSWKVARQGWD